MRSLEVMQVKDYMNVLGISKPTAIKYRNQDLKNLRRQRITKTQFEALYGSIEVK